MSDKDYNASYDADVPLEVRERELKRCIATVRGYLDRLEKATFTEHTAVVFAVDIGDGEHGAGGGMVGFGEEESVMNLLLQTTMKASALAEQRGDA